MARRLALTFDNGPDPELTPHVVDTRAFDAVAAGAIIFYAVTGLDSHAIAAVATQVRRGDISHFEGLKAAAVKSDGVIHVAHRQDLLPSGGLDAVAAAETQIMVAYVEARAESGKPLVVSASIGSPGWEGIFP